MADLSQFKPFTVKVGCLLSVVLVLSMAYEFQFPHYSSSSTNRLLTLLSLSCGSIIIILYSCNQ